MGRNKVGVERGPAPLGEALSKAPSTSPPLPQEDVVIVHRPSMIRYVIFNHPLLALLYPTPQYPTMTSPPRSNRLLSLLALFALAGLVSFFTGLLFGDESYNCPEVLMCSYGCLSSEFQSLTSLDGSVTSCYDLPDGHPSFDPRVQIYFWAKPPPNSPSLALFEACGEHTVNHQQLSACAPYCRSADDENFQRDSRLDCASGEFEYSTALKSALMCAQPKVSPPSTLFDEEPPMLTVALTDGSLLGATHEKGLDDCDGTKTTVPVSVEEAQSASDAERQSPFFIGAYFVVGSILSLIGVTPFKMLLHSSAKYKNCCIRNGAFVIALALFTFSLILSLVVNDATLLEYAQGNIVSFGLSLLLELPQLVFWFMWDRKAINKHYMDTLKLPNSIAFVDYVAAKKAGKIPGQQQQQQLEEEQQLQLQLQYQFQLQLQLQQQQEQQEQQQSQQSLPLPQQQQQQHLQPSEPPLLARSLPPSRNVSPTTIELSTPQRVALSTSVGPPPRRVSTSGREALSGSAVSGNDPSASVGPPPRRVSTNGREASSGSAVSGSDPSPQSALTSAATTGTRASSSLATSGGDQDGSGVVARGGRGENRDIERRRSEGKRKAAGGDAQQMGQGTREESCREKEKSNGGGDESAGRSREKEGDSER